MRRDAVALVAQVEFIGKHGRRGFVPSVLHGSAQAVGEFLRFGLEIILGHVAKNNQFHLMACKFY